MGSISEQDYYEFDVNETQQSGLVKTLKQISQSDQNMRYISRHPNQALYTSTANSDSPCSNNAIPRKLIHPS